jgi:hypothetical protein
VELLACAAAATLPGLALALIRRRDPAGRGAGGTHA